MMEQTKIDIYKSLGKNNGIARTAIIISGIVVVVCAILIFMMHKNHNKYVYGLSKDNSLLPLELIEKKDIENVYTEGHISHYISLFYNIDQYNYKQQIEKSFWLIDESGKKLYEQYTQSGHYNKMIQSSSVQYVKNIQIVSDGKGNFKAGFLVTINKPNQQDERIYRIVVQGSITNEGIKPNYPKNPYGYMIYNLREIEKREITE